MNSNKIIAIQQSLFETCSNESDNRYTSLEICAGAGGQALGLEMAGFKHMLLVEYEADYCRCMHINRPNWNILCEDVKNFTASIYHNQIDLLSGGVPCPPFSIAGKQLGQNDSRDLFPEMLRLVTEINPRLVMIENVRGLLDPKFDSYREYILNQLDIKGYNTHVKLLNASDYGVSQLRPRVIIIGIRKDLTDNFSFPIPSPNETSSVGDLLADLMAENGWNLANQWRLQANKIAPTIVGGSKKHGGPDLGPTRARHAWELLGVDGKGIANQAPEPNFHGMPRLTTRMLARIQGFPDDWDFGSKKTLACRMIGNAFPPPVAKAIGQELYNVLLYNDNLNKTSSR